MATGQYVMTISRMTVDQLGVKIYDRASAVMAELVANSYDADATEGAIETPMGVYLAKMKDRQKAANGSLRAFRIAPIGYYLRLRRRVPAGDWTFRSACRS